MREGKQGDKRENSCPGNRDSGGLSCIWDGHGEEIESRFALEAELVEVNLLHNSMTARITCSSDSPFVSANDCDLSISLIGASSEPTVFSDKFSIRI